MNRQLRRFLERNEDIGDARDVAHLLDRWTRGARKIAPFRAVIRAELAAEATPGQYAINGGDGEIIQPESRGSTRYRGLNCCPTCGARITTVTTHG